VPAHDADVPVLRDHVARTIGDKPTGWPGGWPGEIEAALIDAVFSVRARYGDRARETGVYGAVMRWRRHRGFPADDLNVLRDTAPVDLAEQLENRGKLARHLKAEVVVDAADRMVRAGVRSSADFAAHQPEARTAYLETPGCGPVTWAYLRMLLGVDDVKADTWVMRFVRDAVPGVQSPDRAAALVKAVAADLSVEAHTLDHAIWRYQRAAATAAP
jgi:hypothetical protein